MCTRHARGIEHGSRIARHLPDRIRASRNIASAYPTIIEEDHPALGSQSWNDPEPHVVGKGQPHNEKDGRPGTMLFPIDFRRVGDRKGHVLYRYMLNSGIGQAQ